MDDKELAHYRLRALEMAIDQIRREHPNNFKESVAELQTWLYNRIVTSDSPALSNDGAGVKKQRSKGQTSPEVPDVLS